MRLDINQSRPARRIHASCARRAFSLIEVLIAIFILGVGVISIAALFPAGIAQQRQSTDDVLGPIVANNAISILRTKLQPDDFGTFEDFSPGATLFAPRRTTAGDWNWLRPSFIFDPGADPVGEDGALDIFAYDVTVDGITTDRANEFDGGYTDEFGTTGVSTPPQSYSLYGVPYNQARHPAGPPRILVRQHERYYPQYAEVPPSGIPPRPQYVWDCMFRRYQGRILVAIFVYRVTQPGGESGPYRVASNQSNPTVPPLPIWLDLGEDLESDAWDALGADVADRTDDPFISGASCNEFEDDPFNETYGWQWSGQWLLDQNNNVHRVLSAECDDDDGGGPLRQVELVRPVPAMLSTGVNYMFDATDTARFRGEENVVTDIWYLPILASDDARLTPVYVTVKEL